MTVLSMPPPPLAAPPPKARVRRRDLFKMLCQCIGLASIFLVMNYGDLLGGGSDVRMHVPFALTGICVAQIADILLLGVVIFAILAPLQRTRYYAFVRLLLAVVIPPYILWQLQDLLPGPLRDSLPAFYVLWTLLVLLLYFKFNQWYRRLMRLGDALGVFLAVFALSSIVQLLWITHWHPGPYQKIAAWQSSAQPAREHPRVIWIVFDELSFDQLFEHRAHDLQLPSFDALRSQSTLFTNVQPIGLRTVKIVPSLLTGRTVDDFRFRFNNQFKLRWEGDHSGHYVTGKDTIFHDAQQQGFRTAVVGWYNPYCTIYGDALDSCYFMNLDRIDGLMSQRDNFWRNMYSPLQQMVREIKAPARADRDICTYDVRQRLKTHLDLQQHTHDLLANDQADLVFLHFGVPHSPNIWSRISDDYTTFCDSSYLDNLALTDRVLGRVMAQLQASPRWKDTTVIVQGDHSWRTFLWDWLPAWTDEDDAISREGFDPRPALLIHKPAQEAPQTISTPWPLLRVHDIVEQAIHNQPLHF